MGAGASSTTPPSTPPSGGRGRRHRSRRQVRIFSKAQNLGDLGEHVARAGGLHFSSDARFVERAWSHTRSRKDRVASQRTHMWPCLPSNHHVHSLPATYSDKLKADVILSGSSQGADADQIFFDYCGTTGGPADEPKKAAKQKQQQKKKKTKKKRGGPIIGKFPESGRFCTKIAFAKQLKRASAAIETAGGGGGEGEEGGETPFSFFPQTWCLPDDEQALFDDMSRGRASTGSGGVSGEGSADDAVKPTKTKKVSKMSKKGTTKKRTYIVKPDDGSQGDGIFLVSSREGLASKMRTPHSNGNTVVQRYVEDTMLLDGRKFDLRLYVLVTRLEPLEVYLCKEGLVRVCTESYVQTVEEKRRRTYPFTLVCGVWCVVCAVLHANTQVWTLLPLSPPSPPLKVRKTDVEEHAQRDGPPNKL